MRKFRKVVAAALTLAMVVASSAVVSVTADTVAPVVRAIVQRPAGPVADTPVVGPINNRADWVDGWEAGHNIYRILFTVEDPDGVPYFLTVGLTWDNRVVSAANRNTFAPFTTTTATDGNPLAFTPSGNLPDYPDADVSFSYAPSFNWVAGSADNALGENRNAFQRTLYIIPPNARLIFDYGDEAELFAFYFVVNAGQAVNFNEDVFSFVNFADITDETQRLALEGPDGLNTASGIRLQVIRENEDNIIFSYGMHTLAGTANELLASNRIFVGFPAPPAAYDVLIRAVAAVNARLATVPTAADLAAIAGATGELAVQEVVMGIINSVVLRETVAGTRDFPNVSSTTAATDLVVSWPDSFIAGGEGSVTFANFVLTMESPGNGPAGGWSNAATGHNIPTDSAWLAADRIIEVDVALPNTVLRDANTAGTAVRDAVLGTAATGAITDAALIAAWEENDGDINDVWALIEARLEAAFLGGTDAEFVLHGEDVTAVWVGDGSTTDASDPTVTYQHGFLAPDLAMATPGYLRGNIVLSWTAPEAATPAQSIMFVNRTLAAGEPAWFWGAHNAAATAVAGLVTPAAAITPGLVDADNYDTRRALTVATFSADTTPAAVLTAARTAAGGVTAVPDAWDADVRVAWAAVMTANAALANNATAGYRPATRDAAGFIRGTINVTFDGEATPAFGTRTIAVNITLPQLPAAPPILELGAPTGTGAARAHELTLDIDMIAEQLNIDVEDIDLSDYLLLIKVTTESGAAVAASMLAIDADVAFGEDGEGTFNVRRNAAATRLNVSLATGLTVDFGGTVTNYIASVEWTATN